MSTAGVKEELAEVTTRDPRWALVVARDPTADELFYLQSNHGRLLPTILRCSNS
jgi:hypothetical protein